MADAKKATSLTITFLTPVSFASLNGSDKEADNVSSIKKLTRGSRQFPYVSSQAVRRALRDQLGVLGHTLSEVHVPSNEKGAAITSCEPSEFIDDDLFGFMHADKSVTHKRTGPLRVTPMIALDPYEGDLDFGTNYMAQQSLDKEAATRGPSIYETEIHGGLYRGTVLIELDSVGQNRRTEFENFKAAVKGKSSKVTPDIGKSWNLPPAQRVKRVSALIDALQHLWSSGRQSRFLADISPKFVACALTTAKVPLFLESVVRNGDGIDTAALDEALNDAKGIVVAHCYGARSGLFGTTPADCKTVGEAFDTVRGWITKHYKG